MPALNQSKVKMFRRCQKQYSFRYDTAKQMGLSPKLEMVPRVHKVQLYRGTWLHALQEAHNREWAHDSGFKVKQCWPDGKVLWQDVHASFEAEFDSLFDEEKDELGDLPGQCIALFKGYLKFWRDEAEQYRVAALKDGQPAIEFIVQRSLKRWGVDMPFKGRLDLMVEDMEFGGNWIRDAKWVKNVPEDDERMMSPQNCMYVWALSVDYDIRGFIYDYGRTKAPTVPRVLKKGVLSTAARMDTTYEVFIAAIKELHGETWKDYAKVVYREKLLALKARSVLWYRRDRIPVEDHKIKQALREFIVTGIDIKRRNKAHPPRSYFYNCKFGCEYHGLCVSEFAGLDIDGLIEADYEFTGERYGEEDLLKD